MRSNGRSACMRSTALSTARAIDRASAMYVDEPGPTRKRGRSTTTPPRTSWRRTRRNLAYWTSGPTCGKGGHQGTGETRLASYGDTRVLGNDADEEIRERLLGEGPEALAPEVLATRFPVALDLGGRELEEVLAQLVVPAETPHVDEASRVHPVLDVGSAQVDRDRPGGETVEDLLRHPALHDHVLEADRERVAGKGGALRVDSTAPCPSGRRNQRVGPHRVPPPLHEICEPPELPGNACLPHPIRRPIPADAVDVDLAARLEERDRPQPLRIELVRLESGHLVAVDDREERSVVTVPRLLVNGREGVRIAVRLEMKVAAQERPHRLVAGEREHPPERGACGRQLAEQPRLHDRTLVDQEGAEHGVRAPAQPPITRPLAHRHVQVELGGGLGASCEQVSGVDSDARIREPRLQVRVGLEDPLAATGRAGDVEQPVLLEVIRERVDPDG